jgi:hypothetical protein
MHWKHYTLNTQSVAFHTTIFLFVPLSYVHISSSVLFFRIFISFILTYKTPDFYIPVPLLAQFKSQLPYAVHVFR